MSVIVFSLDNASFERIEKDGKGLSLAMDLYSEYEEADPIVIAASPAAENAAFSILYKSPLTGHLSLSFSEAPFGYSLFSSGCDALVIAGRARKMCGIYISEDRIEFIPSGYDCLPSYEWAEKEKRCSSDVYIGIGPAGENSIYFASLQTEGRDIRSDGLGYVFGQRNLKGIIIPSFQQNRTKALDCFDAMERAISLKWLPVSGYSRRTDPRASFLDDEEAREEYGYYPQPYLGSMLSHPLSRKNNEPLPDAEERMMLGTNLGFFSFGSVMQLYKEARAQGLDAVHLGALLSYLSTRKEDDDYTAPRPEKGIVYDFVRAIRMISQGRTAKGLLGYPKAIQGPYHQAISTDLRGSYPDAIAYSLGVNSVSVSKLRADKPLSAESAAVAFLYESVVSYGLLAKGISPYSSGILYWKRFPQFLYRFPWAIRLYASKASFAGIKSTEILSEGLRILNRLSSEPKTLPDRFTLDVDMLSDGRTVGYTKLMGAYLREKLRLERMLKSRSEKRTMLSSPRRAAVGPDEDLGLEGEPGLQK